MFYNYKESPLGIAWWNKLLIDTTDWLSEAKVPGSKQKKYKLLIINIESFIS